MTTQTRAFHVLSRLFESQSVTLWAVRDEDKIKVGTFADLDAAGDTVELMEKARKDAGPDLKAEPGDKKTPQALLDDGMWPDKWYAHAVDEAGTEYRYTQLVWIPYEPGEAGRSVDPNQHDDRPNGNGGKQ